MEARDGLYGVDGLELLWFEVRTTIHFCDVASIGKQWPIEGFGCLITRDPYFFSV